MTDHVTTLTSVNFDKLTAKGDWAIDFWAEWCGPCKIMSPEFDKAAVELAGKVNFGKVNVDDATEIAQRFEVMSIPSLVFIRNGQEVDRAIGSLPKSAILQSISTSFKQR